MGVSRGLIGGHPGLLHNHSGSHKLREKVEEAPGPTHHRCQYSVMRHPHAAVGLETKSAAEDNRLKEGPLIEH